MSAMVHGAWTPSLGAAVEPEGTAFRVWAPCSTRADVIIERPGGPIVHALARSPDGTFSAVVSGVRAGDSYVDQFLLKHEFIKRLHDRYQREGITIPFPIRTIVRRDGSAESHLGDG